MSRTYNHRKGTTEVVKKGGLLGKVVALLLGLVIGITAGLGGLAGAIYHLIVKVPIDDATDTIGDLTKTEIDISQVLTEEYASKTVWELVGSIQQVSKEFQDGKGSFNTLNKISPTVRKSVEGIVAEVEKYGLALDVNEFMDTPFKELGNYLTAELDEVEVGTLLTKVNVSLKGNPILMALCYGDEDEDYIILEDGTIEMQGNAHPTTIGEFKKLDETLNNLALYSLFSSANFDVHDPLMSTLAFGASTHYHIEKVDGKDKAVMNYISFEVIDSDGDASDTTDVVGKLVDLDGNEYTYEKDEKLNTYIATRVVDKTTTITYNVKYEDGQFRAYDKETDEYLKYQKTTVGDLLVGADPLALIAPVELGKLMNLKAKDNKALLALAYGIQGEDFIILNDEIKMQGNSKPRTIGDLLDSNELNSLFNTLPIDSLINIDTSSELLLSFAYGPKDRYRFEPDPNDPAKKMVVMNPIVFTKDGDKLVDADGKEYAVTSEKNVFTATHTPEGENAKPIVYTVKLIDDVWTAVDGETEEPVKYPKTTLYSLQSDAMGILNNIELGSAMNITPKSNPILLALAYGVEGEDYILVDGNDDGDTEDREDIQPLKKPLTIGGIQNMEEMNEKINTLPLEALLEPKYDDSLMCALMYGATAHYDFIEENGVRTGVKMKKITFTVADDKFVDENGDEFVKLVDADGKEYVLNGDQATHTPEGENAKPVVYTVKEIDGVVTAVDSEGNALSYQKTTIGSLQQNPEDLLFDIALCDVLKLDPTSEPIMIELAYGIKDKDYYIDDVNKNNVIEATDKIVPKSRPKTIRDLQSNPDLFNDLQLATVMNVNANSEPIMIALAYGNEGIDFEFDKDGNGNKIIRPINPPRTVGDLNDQDATVIKSIQLATVLDISPLDPEADAILLELAYGIKGEHYEIVNGKIEWLPKDKNNPDGEKYAPRTIADLQGDENDFFGDIRLATILNVSPLNPDDDSLMVALAFGNKGEHYEIKNGEIEWLPKDKNNPDGEKYDYRTVNSLQDKTLLQSIQLASALNVTPESEAIMIALAYGNEGENEDGGDFTYITEPVLDDEGNPTYDTDGNPIVKKVGFKMNEGKYPRTLGDLQNNTDVLKTIRLATILNVSPLNPDDDSLMVALAYGNKDEHYEIVNGEIKWLPKDKNNPDGEKYAPRTIADLEDTTLLKKIQLAAALDVTPESDAIMIALAYGNEGPNNEGGDFTYITEPVLDDEGNPTYDTDGNPIVKKVGFKMNEGKYPRTLEDLQGDSDVIRTVRLATILDITLEKNPDGTFVDEALMVALAYGNEGEHYVIAEDGKTPIWQPKDKNNPDGEKYTYRTIADLENGDFISEIQLAAALEVTPESEAIMIALAYGNEGENEEGGDFTYITEPVLDDEGNPTYDTDGNPIVKKVGFKMNEGKKPRTLKQLQDNPDIVKDIRLATVLNITPERDADGKLLNDSLMVALAFGNEGEHYVLAEDGKTIIWQPKDKNNPDGEKYTYRTIKDLEDETVINSIQLAAALDVKPDSTPIMIALAYGNEGEDFTYITEPVLDDEGNPTYDTDGNPVVKKVGFEMIGESKPRTLKELQDNPDIVKDIRLATILEITPERDADGALVHEDIMVAIAFGNEGMHYVLDADGKTPIWQPKDKNNPDGEKYTYRTIADLEDASFIKELYLATALEITPDSDPIMIALAYGNEGENEDGGDFTYITKTVEENGEMVEKKVGFKMNEGKYPRTINDLQDNENPVFKTIRLSTVLGVSPLDPDDDAIMVALAYGNEGMHYNITDEGKLEWLHEDNDPSKPKYTYRTIKDLQDNSDLFKEMYLATALEITPDSDPIMIALAYGNEGENEDGGDFTYITKTVEENGETVVKKVGFKMNEGKYPRTLDDLQDPNNTLLKDIRLATVLNNISPLNPDDDAIMVALAYGNKGQHYDITDEGKLEWLHEDNDPSKPKYTYRTIADLQDKPDLFKEMYLATALEVTPSSDAILIELAYGTEGTNEEGGDFTYITETVEENGEMVEKKVGFKMNEGKRPRTLDELQDPNNTLFKDIRLATVLGVSPLNPNDDAIMVALAYGNKGEHYDITDEGKLEWLHEDNDSSKPKYTYRTVGQLQEDTTLFKSMQLATALNITPDSDPIMIALAYGNEGKNEDGGDFTYITETVEENGENVVKKVGFKMNEGKYPRTLEDLQDQDNPLFKTIRLATILNVSPLNPNDDSVMVAIAYGNKGEHYNITDEGKLEWLHEDNDSSKPKYTYRTVDDLDDPSIFKAMHLATALEITPDSDPIMIALAYGNEGEDFTYITETVEESGEMVEKKVGFKMNDGKKPRTLEDLQDPNNTLLKEIRLATVLDVDALDSDADALKVALAYGNKGEHYNITDEGKLEWLHEDNDPSKPKYTYRTIDDLESDPELFKSMYLATALNLSPSSDRILIELAYGVEGEDFNYTYETDEHGNTVKTGFEMIGDNKPRTLKSLEGSNLFNDIRLASALNITPASNPLLIELSYGVENTDFKYVYALDENGNETSEKIGFEMIGESKPRTLGELQDTNNTMIESLLLATALNVKPDSNAILIALAYGKENTDFEYVYAMDENGNQTNEKVGFKMLGDSKPRTIKDLQDPDATIIKDIELSSVLTPEYDDKFMLYVIYGGTEGTHYELLHEDPIDAAKATGVKMLEQRIAILTVGTKTFVYDEYGVLLEAKTGSNTGDYYELTKNGEIYTYAYTAVDKDNDTSTTTTYIAKEADDGETIKVEYLDDKNTSDETDDEFIKDVDATVYWLYAENAQDGDAPLYYQPNTIGALQDGKDISSIAEHLTIKELVGEADDSRLFSTIGDWKMSDLQNQEMIMSLKVEEVIEIKDSDSGLLKAMRNWTLADLSKQENIDGLKIAEIIDIKDDSDENPSPKVLQYIADPNDNGDTSDSWTLGDLNSGKFYDLKLDQIIDITAHSDNVILSHLKDVAVGDLAHEMTKLTFSKLFADEIFVKVLDDGAGNYTFFVDKNGSNTFESEEDKKITDAALIAKYTDGLKGTNNPEILYSLEPIQDNGVTVAYFLYTDRPTYNEETSLMQPNGIADGDEYVIGDHIWWYLLHNQKHCDDDHASGDKQCYVDYTVDDLASLIENMQTNIETATLYTLEEDGLVSFGTRLDGTSLLDDEIRGDVGGIPVGFLVQGADTIGDLTVKQLTDYIFLLVIAIDAYETQNGYVG